jgi:hypothetical protein
MVAICVTVTSCVQPNYSAPEKTGGSYVITVDWPHDGALLSGTQVFRMHINNLEPPHYRAYWQVDTQAPQKMEVSRLGRPEREAEVDIKNWTDRPSGEHRLIIYAEDLQGNRIGEEEISIYGAQLTVVDQRNNNTPASLHNFVGSLENVPPALYNMSWRVDGGQYNEMDDLPSGEKIGKIDVAGWAWRKHGYYVIDFIVTDELGREVLAPHQVILEIP